MDIDNRDLETGFINPVLTDDHFVEKLNENLTKFWEKSIPRSQSDGLLNHLNNVNNNSKYRRSTCSLDGDPIRKADNIETFAGVLSGRVTELLRLPSTEFNDFLRLSSPEISKSVSVTASRPLNNDNFNTYYRSDSPITISNHNSNSNSDASDSDDGQNNIWLESGDSYDPVTNYTDSSYLNSARLPDSIPSHICSSTAHRPKHKNLSFHDVEKSLAQYYSRENTFSSEVDILATYLKGQKNIYIQSNILCKRKLNLLTIPALALTSATIIFAPFTIEYKWGGIFISVMNAVIALLLSMINYLKLESALEMYIYLTKQYEKMELSIELTNHKLIYIDNVKEQEQIIIPKLKEIENKISDIKESHLSILIPEEVKQIFPVICHINILSFIKKIENYKRNLIIQFKDVKNEIRYIRYKHPELFDFSRSPHKEQTESASREKNRLPTLLTHKEFIREELLHYKKAYGYIDEIFAREIKYAEYMNQSWFCCRKPAPVYDYSNPVIQELLQSVFGDE
jgi:hypothetical protein